MDVDKLTAREALEQLPEQIVDIPRGGLRITARFTDGRLRPPIAVTYFRVPPAVITHVAGRAGRAFWTLDDRGVRLLEHAAREMHLDEGDTELVVEYADDRNGHSRSLHWLDFTWHQ